MSLTQSTLEVTAVASVSKHNSEAHEEVKHNVVDSVWKPHRFRKENLHGEDLETQMVYWKFQGILNRLTLRKCNTLFKQVEALRINTEDRLKGITGLMYKQVISDHSYLYLVAYAVMCRKMANLQVPVGKASSENNINFRQLITDISQQAFGGYEEVLDLETELAECTDSAKKKKLEILSEAENRRIRMRRICNVKFIGELYKNKLLNIRIILYCMKFLMYGVKDAELERLCEFLLTIGKQLDDEANKGHGKSFKSTLDNIFKEMQDIVDCKSNNVSKRVRFMLQDTIDLRKKRHNDFKMNCKLQRTQRQTAATPASQINLKNGFDLLDITDDVEM